MSDPFAITQKEKIKYQEQFKALQPQNGVVTGAQAKGFFLQSQLPPLTLGQIWALADTDSDGKMDIKEFSMACKLINLKLRAFDLPKALPPTMLASLSSTGTPILTPTGSMSPSVSAPPVAQVAPIAPPVQATIIQPAGGVAVLPTVPQAMVTNHGMIPTAVVAGIQQHPTQMVTMQSGQPIIASQISGVGMIAPTGGVPILPPGMHTIIPGSLPVVAQTAPQIPTQQTVVPTITSPPTALATVTAAPVPGVIPVLPGPPTPPQSKPQSRSHSISERAPSLESPQMEWAIKGPTKLKYTQLFNTTDRTRSGYLTGVQARNILMQSKLPQATLAQIWALSDMDSDGRLGCEEFVLAMYLCDRAISGEKIPVTLPPDLIPPTFRKVQSRHGSVSGSVPSSRHGSVSGSSRHASVSSQGTSEVADPAAGLPGQTSFEDKRKENFDKGQAELDRRRKLLMDQQKKEIEERERKEREEAEKREKARLEAERKEQEELERQLQQQRELAMEKEEQRKRALEAKEKARQELEKQRQLEWETQRIAEMNSQKQREQEKVLKLKAQNQTLSVELSTLTEKIRELSQNICDTRAGVTNVKTFIDGMRSTRDVQMTEMSQLKAQIKEQNAKLLQLTQERSKWDAKMKSGQSMTDSALQEQMNAAFSNKQLIIKQLQDKINDIKEQVEAKQNDITSNDIQLNELKSELRELIDKCEELYSQYDTLRIQVLEMKHNRKNESFTSSAWGAEPADAWGTTEAQPIEQPAAVSEDIVVPEGFAKYRAVFEFEARNSDEISFQPGDIVLVPFEQNAEPGWLAGEINGHTGWFPETYVEKIYDPEEATAEIPQDNYNIDNNEEITEIPVAAIENEVAPVEATHIPEEEAYNGDLECLEYYIAAYPYDSAEVGDLSFQAGEMVIVIKKEGEWWTGTIGTRTGMFPSNYVQKTEVGQNIAQQTVATTESYEYQPPEQKMSFEQKDNLNGIANQLDNNYDTTLPPQHQVQDDTTTNQYVDQQPIDDSVTQQEELDTEVSQITTQQKMNSSQSQIESQGSFSRPMSRTSSMTPGMRARKSEIAQVIAPYEATSSEQLSLTRGQLIMIRKKTDSGWWEGELQAKGRKRQIGWFPASYVKVLQGGRNSGRNTPVSGSRIEMTEAVLDKVIALYPYKAQNDDELSFDKDDIIAVLGREEPEWWRGELNGLTGVFPSNYVGPFVTSGNV